MVARARGGSGLALAALACLLLLAYGQVNRAYPFYYLWDMDWTTTLDLLLIRSGQLPDHVNHTGFGMYLVLSWSHAVAHALGQVSLLDLSDVHAAGNPLLGAAELTDFVRAHTPFVLVMSVLAQLAVVRGVARLARPRVGPEVTVSAWFAALVLLVLGMQDGLFYHATVVRTELYSLLFWSLGAWAAVAALRARSRRTSGLRFSLCGALLALSWSTKLQSLILIGWLLIACALVRELGWARSPLVRLEPAATGRGRLASGLVLFAAFALVAAAAKAAVVPPGVATFTEGYRFNSAALLALVAYALPLLLAITGRRLVALEALLGGGLAAFGLHFLVYASPLAGWVYLLVDTKMLLFRTTYQNLDRLDVLVVLERLTTELRDAPATYVVHAGVFALALRATRHPRCRALLLLTELVLLLHIALATRTILRDVIWCRLPVVLWSIALCTALLARRRSPPWGVMGLLLLLLAAQVGQTWRLPAQVRTLYVDYGWRVDYWATFVYSGGQRRYAALVAPKIDPLDGGRWLEAAAGHARAWAQAKGDLRHVLVGHAADLRDVTTAREGFVLPRNDAARLTAVPPHLRGGLIVRPASSRPTVVDLGGASAREFGATAGRADAREALGVLGRPDLDVVLFLPADTATPAGWVEGPEAIEVTGPTGPHRFRAHRPRERYGEVDPSRFDGGAFVLVKPRF